MSPQTVSLRNYRTVLMIRFSEDKETNKHEMPYYAVLWIRNNLVLIRILLYRSFRFWIQMQLFKPGLLNNCKIFVYIMGLLQDLEAF